MHKFKGQSFSYNITKVLLISFITQLISNFPIIFHKPPTQTRSKQKLLFAETWHHNILSLNSLCKWRSLSPLWYQQNRKFAFELEWIIYSNDSNFFRAKKKKNFFMNENLLISTFKFECRMISIFTSMLWVKQTWPTILLY